MKSRKFIFYLFYFFSFLTIFNIEKVNALEKKKYIELQVENFFKNLNTLEADFIQVSPSGKVRVGKMYLDLPGKLRIDYKEPSDLLITCKGFWIVIQNRKLKTTSNIPLKKSPFSILLEKKSILNNKNLKSELNTTAGTVSLKIKNSQNTSFEALILEFSEKPFNLKKWTVHDTFGEITTVLIQNAKYNNELSYLLFFPDDFPEISNSD